MNRRLLLCACSLTSAFTLAGGDMPLGIFQGKFAALDGSAVVGRLSVEDKAGTEYSCTYDSRSYFEMDKARIMPVKLQKGDSLEVVADRKPGTRDCYARIVHIVTTIAPARRPASAETAKPPRVSDLVPQRGDRTVAGIVLGREGSKLRLRTRDGERSVLLRPDTRFLNNGVKLDASELPVNTHVFIRAGRTMSGQIEAYQVMWGDLVQAR